MSQNIEIHCKYVDADKERYCIACKSNLKTKVLDMGSLPFFYGIRNDYVESLLNNRTFKSQLMTCPTCKLTQQVMHEETVEMTEKIYHSAISDASSPMSNSGWGMKRVKAFFENTDFTFQPNVVLEIGCQNGFLLYELYKRGAKELLGIEPSPKIPFQKNGFTAKIIHSFFDENLILNKKFDTVIALWVLEHVTEPVRFLRNIANILHDDGQMIIAIPNSEIQMEKGDPGLFMHEHFSFFSERSIATIFSLAGFKPIRINKTNSDFYVTAKKDKKYRPDDNMAGFKDPLIDYHNSLNRLVKRFLCQSSSIKRLGLWGACTTAVILVNILKLKQYVLFDGDPLKQDNEISGLAGIVFKPDKETLENLVDCICIVPIGFQKEIGNMLNTYNFKYFNLFES